MKEWNSMDLDCPIKTKSNWEDTIEILQERLSELPVPDTEHTLFDYTNGRCDFFAQALCEELGYTMEFLWDFDFQMDHENFHTPVLVHAYCITSNGKLIDARGQVSHKIIDLEYEYNSKSFERPTLETLTSDDKYIDLTEISKKELSALKNFIRENLAFYQNSPTHR